jgi:hypothetical protein
MQFSDKLRHILDTVIKGWNGVSCLPEFFTNCDNYIKQRLCYDEDTLLQNLFTFSKHSETILERHFPKIGPSHLT